MRTPLASIAMFLAASLFGALGQYLYKSGADQAQGGSLAVRARSREPSGSGHAATVDHQQPLGFPLLL